jgi:plastocyanin
VTIPCLLLLAFAAPCGAVERQVKMFEGVFLPASLSIEVGDSVTWTWVEGDHRLVSGASSQDPQAGLIFDVPIDAGHTSFTYLFDLPGNFAFFDRLNESVSGPGNVTVVPFTVELEVVDLAFTPEEVSIFEGDAVEWIWIEGDHTITSGDGSEDPQVGQLFDVPSNAAQTQFTYAFIQTGIYDYFCRPHEHLGMKGVVRVQRRFIRGDLGGDGTVDISDAILILGSLFLGQEARPCPDAGDGNDDGTVDISDAVWVLAHLFLGGSEIPPPYPRSGPDRTEDGLECW